MTTEMKCEADVISYDPEEGAIPCGRVVSEKVANYSKERYGKVYCFECQKGNPLIQKELMEKRINKPKDITHQYQKTSDNWEDEIVNFETLLSDAHSKGLKEIKTQLLEKDMTAQWAIFKARVSGDNGYYEATGDATQDNCQSSMIKPHFIRMAETRAICRALRWYTNNAQVSKEEIE